MKTLSLSMNSMELSEWIVENGPVHVTFSKKSENMESYPEENIQALIIGVIGVIGDGEDVCKWKMDYTMFEVINSLHESLNYYDEMEVGRLRAYATIHYKRKEELYVTRNEPLSQYLLSVEPVKQLEIEVDAVENRFATINKSIGNFCS